MKDNSELLQNILGRLEKVSSKPERNGDFKALCPFHDDHNPSLSVGAKGYICFACGAKGGLKTLAEKLGMDTKTREMWDELQADAGLRRRGVREETARYFGIVADIKRQAWRYPVTTSGPRYKHFHRGDGGIPKYWHEKGTPDQLYYGGAIEREMWVVNGEPSVWVCWQAGIPAVCNVHGEGKLSAALARDLHNGGCEVAHVVYDNDKAGREGSAKVAQALRGAGIDTDVRDVGLDVVHADVADLYVRLGDDEKFRDAMRALEFKKQEADDQLALRTMDVVRQPYYEMRDGEIWYVNPKVKYSRSGDMINDTDEMQLTNFSLEIIGESSCNDGDEVLTQYDLAGRTVDRPFKFVISSVDLSDERKVRAGVLTHAGGKAIIHKRGTGHLVPAVQCLSNGYRREMFYTATGWYQMTDGWVFLTPGANIARMDVPFELRTYRVERSDEGLTVGLDATRALLDAFPHEVIYVALAHAFLAPLYRWLDFSRYALHLVGETGALKTALSLVLLSYFGDFDDSVVKEGWRSTMNRLEVMGYHAKDVLFLIDDFKPRYVKMSDFTQLIHNYADNRGRGRLRRDATVSQTKPMRCLLLSTGEDIPEGEASVLSRMVTLRMRRNVTGVNAPLQMAQRNRRHLPAVMAEYLHGLPEDINKDRVSLWRDESLREFAGKSVNPGRIATNMALNRMGWEMMAVFFEQVGMWTTDERRTRTEEYLLISRMVLEQQAERIKDEKVSAVFLDALRSLIESGKAALLPRHVDTDPVGRDDTVIPMGAVMVGWRDAEGVYLLGSVAYHAVEVWKRQAGGALGFSDHAVWEQLYEDGLLTRSSDGRSSKTMRIRGEVKRVVHLTPDVFAVSEAEEEKEVLPF